MVTAGNKAKRISSVKHITKTIHQTIQFFNSIHHYYYGLYKLFISFLFNHSHKKRKDSLETRAERAVIHAYFENQAMLKPILLYRASKYKQTK